MALVTIVVLILFGWLSLERSEACQMDQVEDKCGCCPKPCCCHCIVKRNVMRITPVTTSSTTFIPECNSTLDLGFCLYISDIAATDMIVINQFIADIIGQFPTEPSSTQVAIVTCGANANVLFGFDSPLNNNHEARVSAIKKIRPGVNKNIPECLEKLAELYTERSGRAAVVIMDSKVDIKKADLEEAARKLQEKVDIIAVIGITKDVNMSELETVASGPDDTNVFRVDQIDHLLTTLGSHVRTVCTTPPPPRSTSSWEEVTYGEEECFCCCPPPPVSSYATYGYRKRY